MNEDRSIFTQEQIWALLEELQIVISGHFVLASGRHGDSYLNKDVIYQTPAVVSFLCSLFAFHAREMNIDVVAGPTVGGVPLSQFTALHLSQLKPSTVLTGSRFGERSVTKDVRAIFVDEGEGKKRILKRGYDAVVKGRRVLMVEDIVTTGGSLKKSVEAIEEAGGYVAGACVLVNRNPETITAESLNVRDLFCLVEHQFADFSKDECPLCQKKLEINTNVGKGAQFLAN